MGKRYVDLTGQRFGRLVVQKYLYTDNHRRAVWECLCDCGNKIPIRSDVLKSQTRSCGCLQLEKVKAKKGVPLTHGLTGTRIYNIYAGIKQRCFNKNSFAYKNYGARGITMCEEWRNSITSFYEWAMQNGYKENLSLDRINNDGDYCPQNCRWATAKEQCRNTSVNHLLTYQGETRCLKEWSEILGIRYNKILWRINHGWPEEKLLIN